MCSQTRPPTVPETYETDRNASSALVQHRGRRLQTHRLAAAPWVACREIAVLKPPDRLAAAEQVVVVDRNELMAALAQLVQRCRREAALDAHLHALQRAETGAVAGRLRVLAVVGDAYHDLHMPLRLHRPAHDAEAHYRCAVFGHEAGNDGVVGTL